MSRSKRAAIAAAMILATTLVGASQASAKPATLPAQVTPATQAQASTAATNAARAIAEALAAVVTYPLRGEGMIRITTRVCGNAGTWQAEAARNGVVGPVWLVRYGQPLTITCQPGAGAPAAPPAQPSSGWANPLPGVCRGDGLGAGRGHEGVDLGAPYGMPIRAAAAGQVVATGWSTLGGNDTAINHGGIWTAYMHQASRTVTRGQWVTAGQIIGYVGTTGQLYPGGPNVSPHLHFEINRSGPFDNPADPVAFMAARGITWAPCYG